MATKNFKIGDRVRGSDPFDGCGTVVQVNPAGSILVHWDDQQSADPELHWCASDDVTACVPKS